ncbi:MAG: Carbon monoxide dehydrogenase subunit [Rhizobium sp.]|nr:Carbon monoxide dehydrogenase subunit [Rhizobium sp.]
MDMSGEERIPASREAVWAALNNPNVLRKCIPGCETMEKKSATEMTATVKVKVGPVSASFKGNVTLANLNPPESYTIIGEGSGGMAGFAKGSTDVLLREEGGETVVTYTVKAQIGGKLAMLGSRLIDSSSKRLAGQFFQKLNKIVTKRAEPSEA